jgi:hypothetical protein
MIAASYKYSTREPLWNPSKNNIIGIHAITEPSPPMAAEGIAETTLPLPPRVSASSAPTVGALLARASAAVTKNSGERPSLLSRILHRGRSGGFSCRLRLPLPRSCFSGAAAKEEDVVAAPKVIASRPEPREPPPSSSMAGT